MVGDKPARRLPAELARLALAPPPTDGWEILNEAALGERAPAPSSKIAIPPTHPAIERVARLWLKTRASKHYLGAGPDA